MDYVCLTLSVDDLIDFMRVIRILGIVLYHLEAHREVVQSTSEVGFPPGLVVGELVDFTTCYCPRLSTTPTIVNTMTEREHLYTGKYVLLMLNINKLINLF